MKSLREEWTALTRACGTDRWAPLAGERLAALEAAFDLSEPTRTLMALGWPPQPLVVGGYDRVFLGVEEMLELAGHGWPRAWFPFSAIGDHYVLFDRSDHEGAMIWAVYNDGSDSEPDGSLTPSGIVWSGIEAFIRAVRTTLRWVRPDSFESVSTGRWPLKRTEQRMRPAVEAAIAASGDLAEGPLVLPKLGAATHPLDEPLYERDVST